MFVMKCIFAVDTWMYIGLMMCYPSSAIGLSHAQQCLVNVYIAVFVRLLPRAQHPLVGKDPLFDEA
jgi:hypothetical protein